MTRATLIRTRHICPTLNSGTIVDVRRLFVQITHIKLDIKSACLRILIKGPTSPFEGATTHKTDFNEKKADTIHVRKPPTANRREPGVFDSTTTNRQDYRVFEGARQQRSSYRPKSSRYLVNNVPFDVCFYLGRGKESCKNIR